jgi:DNA repair exonuclease SbcCD ATPase subunit
VSAALQPVLAKRSELASYERRIVELTTEETRITSDQQRLRENMKALRGSAEEKLLLQRYTNQLNEQETRLEALRQSIATTRSQAEAARAQLTQSIRELKFEL